MSSQNDKENVGHFFKFPSLDCFQQDICVGLSVEEIFLQPMLGQCPQPQLLLVICLYSAGSC